MRFRPLQKKISYIIAILVLVFGMCSANVGGHSVFVLQTISTTSATSLTAASVYTPKSATSKQAYTAEIAEKPELLISPGQESRKVISRLGNRSVISFLPALFCFLFVPTVINAYFKHFYNGISISTIIINYIHKQDGDKHRLLPV